MNPWETSALEYYFDKNGHPTTSGADSTQSIAVASNDSTHDAIIYPGLYAPSGFDMMNILVRVMTRPNPVVDLGAIDASCALVLCDLQQPDCPIVYANDPFVELTGYRQNEILGLNCRFLQAPGGKVQKSSLRKHIDTNTVKTMRRAIESNTEIAIEVTNFKRNGQMFVNFLTMVPICWDSDEPRYSVGFQAEKTW